MTGIIKLTSALENQSSLVLFTRRVSSANGLAVSFDFFSYGGSGADGISFFFIDGAQLPTQAGAFGGSLGYAQRVKDGETIAGLRGGYLGIGFDEFGNFSDPDDGRVGGPGFTPDSIAVRGSMATNYRYLGGTGQLPSLDVRRATDRDDAKRRARVELSQLGVLNVLVDFNNDGDFDDSNERPIRNLNVLAAGNGALPNNFRFGFAASTGERTNIHEVGNFSITDLNGTPISGVFTSDRVFVGSGLLEGTSGDDRIRGDVTDDELRGLAGNDTLLGAAGNDLLLGATGNDLLNGGIGLDTLFGGVGDDMLYGSNGNDLLEGGGGNDSLYGGNGNDRIFGRGGNDFIVGGLGTDTLVGGPGSDRYVYSGNTQAQAFKHSTFNRRDRIIGFLPRQGDRILLDYDNNLSTIDRPTRLFNAGRRTGKLRQVLTSVYTDRAPGIAGNQALRPNQATFFRVGAATYLTVNDATPGFSPTSDLVINVTGMRFQVGDLQKTTLAVRQYFA